MTNRIIKSLDCCKIILIFCILEVDFAISVITLFMVFNEAFQKALVYKSVCVINIALLIVLPSIKNPLFDGYFNRVTALLTVRFLSVMRAYLGPFALLTAIFFPVMRAYLGPTALFALRFPLVMRAYLGPFTLPALIFVFFVFAKIFQIMRCSGFGHISYFFFHFIKQKNLNSFCKIFQNLKFQIFPRISHFKKITLFTNFSLEFMQFAKNFFSSQKGKEENKLRVFFSEEKKTQCFHKVFSHTPPPSFFNFFFRHTINNFSSLF